MENSVYEAPDVQFLLPEAVCNSVVSDAREDRIGPVSNGCG